MKKLLIGVGAIAATAFALKKVIDHELENKEEYIYEFEPEEELEIEDEEPFHDLDEVDEEELRRMFEESSQPAPNNVFDDVVKGIKNFVDALPKVSINIRIEESEKKNKE